MMVDQVSLVSPPVQDRVVQLLYAEIAYDDVTK